ncbi:MAG: hypothetical protein HKN89_04325, partial [Eudoraea sp.]|nr:hypothetical protein [Eudoraea sp.]
DSVFYTLDDVGGLMLYGGMGHFLLKDYQYDNVRNDKRFKDQFEAAKVKMREIRKQVPSVDPDYGKVH